MHVEPMTLGRGAVQLEARALAAQTAYLLERYVREVVAVFDLCPHLYEVEAGLGKVFVVMDRTLDVELVVNAASASEHHIIHVAFPCTDLPARSFERFANEVVEGMGRRSGRRLVHAAFHPEMSGSTESPGSLVGILRRSPDPLLQLMPSKIPQCESDARLEDTYRRMREGRLEDLLATQLALRLERARCYAPFEHVFGAFAW